MVVFLARDHKDGLRKNCKDCVAEYMIGYRQKNKETIAIKIFEYGQKNKEIIKIKRRKRNQERRKNDPVFKFRDNFTSLFKRYLKANGINKNNISTYTILGYTPEEIRAHIEALFSHPNNLTPDGQVWMTWENQGAYNPKTWTKDPATWKWQLDHKHPQSEFNCISLDDPQIKECWALDNLRPLSADKNHSDGVNRVRHKK